MAARKKTTEEVEVKEVETEKVDTEETAKEEVVDTKKKSGIMTRPKQNKFNDDDEIPCRSITEGFLIMVGKKSDETYTWQGSGDVQYIEYRDLIAAIRAKSKLVYKPRFIILEDEIVQHYSDIAQVYENLYSINDLKDILDLPRYEMRDQIVSLPEGAKDALKILVSTMIDNGEFDSANKIKILDEIFDTKMLSKLVQ